MSASPLSTVLLALCLIRNGISEDNFLNVTGCGRQIQARIRSGRSAHVKQYPWLVSIRFKEKHECTGALVTLQHVVSAAHCIRDLSSMDVLYGASQTPKEARKALINKSFLSGDYIPADQSGKGVPFKDIVVFALDQKLIPSQWVRPICISEDLYESTNLPVTMAGWGAIDDGPVRSDSLQHAESRVLDPNDERCKKDSHWGEEFEICVLDDASSGICAGDSGGPLTTNIDGISYLIGVASYATPKGNAFIYVCAAKDAPSIYVRLSAVRDFIREAVQRPLEMT